jgi:hypothetical protein
MFAQFQCLHERFAAPNVLNLIAEPPAQLLRCTAGHLRLLFAASCSAQGVWSYPPHTHTHTHTYTTRRHPILYSRGSKTLGHLAEGETWELIVNLVRRCRRIFQCTFVLVIAPLFTQQIVKYNNSLFTKIFWFSSNWKTMGRQAEEFLNGVLQKFLGINVIEGRKPRVWLLCICARA